MRARIGTLTAALAILLAHAWFFSHTCDDAFISFRYAHNFARGHGLVFNLGERVMGYSDLSWVLALGGLEMAGVPSPLGARVLGAIFACATVLVIEAHLRRAGRDPRVPVAMLVLNASFAMWVFGGLEGHLFAFLIALAATRAIEQRSFYLVGVALGVATATRPEGFLYLAPFAAYLLLKCGRWNAARAIGPALALFAAQALFAQIYYGHFVPNTYWAKSEPLSLAVIARGLSLSAHYVITYAAAPLVIAALGAREALRNVRCVLPVLILGTFLAFYLRIGGDVLVFHRLWLTTLPMLALLAAELRVPRVVALYFALFGVMGSRGEGLEYLRKEDRNLRALRVVAERMRAELPAGTVLAANVVGVLTYGSELPMVDMLGLTDEHIARAPKAFGLPGHEAHDGHYVLSREPDVIVWGYPLLRPTGAPLEKKPMYPPDFDLLAEPALEESYAFTVLTFPEGDLAVWAKKSWLSRRSP